MRTYPLNRYDGAYNESGFYELAPVLKVPVAPATSAEIDYELKLQTAALSQNVITSAGLDVYFFYVPNRIVWENWIDFIAEKDPATDRDWET